MDGSVLQLVLFTVAAAALGIVSGYLVAAGLGQRRIRQLTAVNRQRLEEIADERDQADAKYAKARSSFDMMKTALKGARREQGAAVAKAEELEKSVQTLRTERENTKIKVSTLQGALKSVNQKTLSLQHEFSKASKFYKRELTKSFDRRKELEQEIGEARAEQEAFAKRVEASTLEHGSEEEMVIAAQLRFGQIEVLERNIAKLELENEELRDEARQLKKDYDKLQQELDDVEALKINNQQLVRCVESLEKRRAQHELEADEFRDKADQSEQLSETLRLKLDDLEKNFAVIEEQQQQALDDVRSATSDTPAANDSQNLKQLAET